MAFLKNKKRIALFISMVVVSLGAFSSAANLSTNLNWCTANSGAISISYGECNGLAYLYNETSGDNWIATGNWFSSTTLTGWAHPNGYSTGALTIAGGHLKVLNLDGGRLSGAIVTGLQLLPYLTGFSAYSNGISGINFSQSSGLQSLSIQNNSFTGINLSLLTGLLSLNIGSFGMTSLDISHNINLRSFGLTYTNMTWIDMSHNTLLTGVTFGLNILTGLDFRNNTLLEEIRASYNMTPTLASINVSGLTYLKTLYADYAGLRNIDLSTNTSLERFASNNSSLTGLNVSGLNNLQMIGVYGNAIPSIDVSHTPNLLYLYMGGQTGGVFTGLDISHNTGLLIVDTTNNPLARLTVASNGSYSGALIAYFDANVLDPYSLDLNTLQFLHDHYAAWGYRGFGGGQSIVIKKDTCPNGDYSMTQYDNTCDAPAVPQSSSSSSAGTTISPVTTPITLTPVTTTPVTPITPSSSTPTVVLSTNATSRDVYNWAFTNHITTLPLAKARLYDSIQRYEAAKMIVQFVTNVEKKTIAHNPTCNVSTYIDYNTFDAEMKTNIQSICDLGLMGWKGDKSSLLSSFRPFDTLSAEEFGIVIGRYLGESASQPNSSKRVDIMRFLGNVSNQ